MANNFLGKTVNRDAELAQIFNFMINPERFFFPSKKTVLVLLAGSGTGKTHIVDEIADFDNSTERVQRNLEKEFTHLKVENTPLVFDGMNISWDDVDAFTQKKREIYVLPLSLNNKTDFRTQKQETNASDVLVSRMLFTHFIEPLNNQTFEAFLLRYETRRLIKILTPNLALSLIREDIKRTKPNARIVVAFDEIKAAGSLEPEIYSLLKDLVLGLFSFFLLSFSSHHLFAV